MSPKPRPNLFSLTSEFSNTSPHYKPPNTNQFSSFHSNVPNTPHNELFSSFDVKQSNNPTVMSSMNNYIPNSFDQSPPKQRLVMSPQSANQSKVILP